MKTTISTRTNIIYLVVHWVDVHHHQPVLLLLLLFWYSLLHPHCLCLQLGSCHQMNSDPPYSCFLDPLGYCLYLNRAIYDLLIDK